MIHYELFILFSLGFAPKEVIRIFGYSRGTAYRFYRIYRIAGKRARDLIEHRNSVSPRREHKTKNLGAGLKKKGRPPAEKHRCLLRDAETGEYSEVWL